ncbi:MAG: amino acid--tRNA ligase-related protein, partial [Gammaproteobacteria bacterium]
MGLAEKPLDTHFLAALNAGLPDCIGVALGIDRLLILKLGVDSISEVMAFDSNRA